MRSDMVEDGVGQTICKFRCFRFQVGSSVKTHNAAPKPTINSHRSIHHGDLTQTSHNFIDLCQICSARDSVLNKLHIYSHFGCIKCNDKHKWRCILVRQSHDHNNKICFDKFVNRTGYLHVCIASKPIIYAHAHNGTIHLSPINKLSSLFE